MLLHDDLRHYMTYSAGCLSLSVDSDDTPSRSLEPYPSRSHSADSLAHARRFLHGIGAAKTSTKGAGKFLNLEQAISPVLAAMAGPFLGVGLLEL